MTALVLWLFLPLYFHSSEDVPDLVTVTVHIKNIQTEEGLVALGLFLDNESFLEIEPHRQLYYEKDAMENGEMIVQFEIAPGVYGISALDDLDRDDEMRYNWLGIPKEGFGFSNYYHRGFSKPHFDKWKFEVKPKETLNVEIVFRYM